MKFIRNIFKAVRDYTKSLNDLDEAVEAVKDFWYGKARKKIKFEGNTIKANVDLKELKKTLKKSFGDIGVLTVFVKYGDGGMKPFQEHEWHLFGRDIMKNRQGIKVIVVKKR